MNAQTRAQNEKLRGMQGHMTKAEAGAARVNERAKCNVTYYS